MHGSEPSQVPVVRGKAYQLGAQTLSQHRSALHWANVPLFTLVSVTAPFHLLCLLHQRGSFSFAVKSFHSYSGCSTTWGQWPGKTWSPSVLIWIFFCHNSTFTFPAKIQLMQTKYKVKVSIKGNQFILRWFHFCTTIKLCTPLKYLNFLERCWWSHVTLCLFPGLSENIHHIFVYYRSCDGPTPF